MLNVIAVPREFQHHFAALSLLIVTQYYIYMLNVKKRRKTHTQRKHKHKQPLSPPPPPPPPLTNPKSKQTN